MDKKAHAHPKKFGCGSAALGNLGISCRQEFFVPSVKKSFSFSISIDRIQLW